MSSPLYDKRAARHDFVEIDGTDWSNAFREFDFSSAHALLPAGGFSVTGVDENIDGATTQGFTGTALTHDDLLSALWVIHTGREEVLVRWRKNGLVDGSAPLFYAQCKIPEMSSPSSFGDVDTMPVSFSVSDANGIRMTGT